MPRAKGTAKTGGRKRGTPNKQTAEVEQKAAILGMLPKEFLLYVMNANFKAINEPEDSITIDMRIDAAGKVAPYIHRKMPQVVQISDLSDLTDDELRQILARAESGATGSEAGGTSA
jgi:hypothetical protein